MSSDNDDDFKMSVKLLRDDAHSDIVWYRLVFELLLNNTQFVFTTEKTTKSGSCWEADINSDVWDLTSDGSCSFFSHDGRTAGETRGEIKIHIDKSRARITSRDRDGGSGIRLEFTKDTEIKTFLSVCLEAFQLLEKNEIF